MSRSQRYFLANEAGQKATIDTVEAVTDQKIDHFAEVNLAGFFYLAQSFGGVEVCVKSWDGPDGPGTNLHDANSGFNAPHAGYLHLAADQALAFVRERDNLPNGDLDRTHRQQAVLDYVIWKLKTGGVLTDVGQLTGLLGTADKYLITDSSWNLLDFSTQMHALSGENLKFYTAPIVGYETVDGQDANQIDIPAIQAAIKAKFTAPAPSAGRQVGVEAGQEGGPDPGRLDRHGRRLQRRQHRRAGRPRLGRAGRQGLPGRRRHRRGRAVADRQAGERGVLRRGGLGQRGQDRRLLRRDRHRARLAARRARGDPARHRVRRRAGRPGAGRQPDGDALGQLDLGGTTAPQAPP